MKTLINQVIAHKITGNLGKCDLEVTLRLIKYLRNEQLKQIENKVIANKIKQEKIK